MKRKRKYKTLLKHIHGWSYTQQEEGTAISQVSCYCSNKRMIMIQHTTKRFSDTTHQEGALESKSNHNWATEHCLTGKKKKKITIGKVRILEEPEMVLHPFLAFFKPLNYTNRENVFPVQNNLSQAFNVNRSLASPAKWYKELTGQELNKLLNLM